MTKLPRVKATGVRRKLEGSLHRGRALSARASHPSLHDPYRPQRLGPRWAELGAVYSDGCGTSKNRADYVHVYVARPGRRDATCEIPLVRMDLTVSPYKTTVLYCSTVPLYCTTAPHHSTIATVRHYCAAPQYSATVRHFRAAPQYSATVRHHLAVPQYSATVRHHRSAPQYSAAAPHHCILRTLLYRSKVPS